MNQPIDDLRARAQQGHAESQFRLSQVCFSEQDLEQMIHWLQQAAAGGSSLASDALGYCHEKGLGVSRDCEQALVHYDTAIDDGSAQASFRKAELLYKSSRGRDEESTIRGLLESAAARNNPQALRVIGYLAMQCDAGRDVALASLARAAAMGDPVSAFNLGWRLLQGWNGEAGRSQAAYWLRKATSAGYPFARFLLSQAVKGPLAPTAVDPEASLALPDEVAIEPPADPVQGRVLSDDPEIRVIAEVLDIADCAYLIHVSSTYMKRADVINPESNSDGMASAVRTNQSADLPFHLMDVITRYAELKIVNSCGQSLDCSEPLEVLHYQSGEFYRPHVDYFDPKLKVSAGLLENGGQRTASAVTYLSEPVSGGGTRFPDLDLEVPPVAGSTLFFRNCRDDGRVIRRSVHAGQTVHQGAKWAVTKWFRQRPTSYMAF